MLTRPAVLEALPPLLQARLAAHFDRSVAFFAPAVAAGRLEALVLSGGYGRAEGGVAVGPDGQPALFNDLDYFLFCPDPEDRALRAQVRQWEAEESALLGIDVEGVCLRFQQIDASGESMMFYDFLHHHAVIIGAPDAIRSRLAAPPHGRIAPVEATRLLWNRGSGLLFARADLDLAESPARAALVHRNQAKVLLGLGDAWLALHGRYRPRVAEREAQLAQAPDVPARLREWHAQGAAFKRQPSAPPAYPVLRSLQAPLTAAWQELFLQVESARTGEALGTAAAYARFPQRLFAHSPVWRNGLLALRDRLRRGGHLSPWWDYPRSALQRALPLLLAPEIDFVAVARLLGPGATDLATATAVYRRWWQFYS